MQKGDRRQAASPTLYWVVAMLVRVFQRADTSRSLGAIREETRIPSLTMLSLQDGRPGGKGCRTLRLV